MSYSNDLWVSDTQDQICMIERHEFDQHNVHLAQRLRVLVASCNNPPRVNYDAIANLAR